MTVVPSGQLQYLTIFPDIAPPPLVSTLNSLDGRVVANMAILGVPESGSLGILTVSEQSKGTDVIIDVLGQFSRYPPD